MLLRFDNFEELDFPGLMAIYRESNEENAAEFYPDCRDPEEGRKMVEERFRGYLEDDFFTRPGTRYYVLRRGDEWVSAVRLFPVPERDNCWYAEALETRPDRRREGAAYELLRALFEELSRDGTFEITDSVSKKNEASLKLHKACGFKVFQEESVCVLNRYRNPWAYGLKYAGE